MSPNPIRSAAVYILSKTPQQDRTQVSCRGGPRTHLWQACYQALFLHFGHT